MTAQSLILNIEDFCVLKGEIVDKILLSSNPDVALVYLYISRKKSDFDLKKAANELGFSKDRLDIAIHELLTLKIVQTNQPQNEHKPFFEKKPTYSITELKNAKKDPTFEAICDTTEKIFSRPMTDAYIKTLLYLYDELKMQFEVIIELISYLKNSRGSIPTKGEIEREARVWLDLGIHSHADAINYITTKFEQRPVINLMAEALGISGRAISKEEEHYITNFIKLGFSPEVVSFVCETIKNENGQFSKKRLFYILMDYKEKNLFTKEQILITYPYLAQKSSSKKPTTAQSSLEPWEIRALQRRKGGFRESTDTK